MKVVKKQMFMCIVVPLVLLITTEVAQAKEWWWEEIPYTLGGMHMVLGTDGVAYFAGLDANSLYLASRGPGGWSRELVITSPEIDHVSLALDTTNVPHIAYVVTEGEQKYLEHAWRSEDDWSIERIASVSTLLNWSPSLAAAPSGAIGLAYLVPRAGEDPDAIFPSLAFAEKNGAGWSYEIVAPGIWFEHGYNIVRGGLRYDYSSSPHLGYEDDRPRTICYATRGGTQWLTEEVYYSSWGVYDCILRLDSVGQPVIGFVDWYSDGKLSWRIDGTWQTEDAPWGWRQEHNFAIDADDNVRALRYDWSRLIPPRRYQYYYERDAATSTWWQDTDWPFGSIGGGLLNIEVDNYGLTHFAINTHDGRLIYGMEIPEPEIDVSPLAYDFGDVEVGKSSTVFITISNVGIGNLTVSDIAFVVGSSGDFAITASPLLPATVTGPDGFIEVEITYAPSAVGASAATLEIISDDEDEGVVEVALSGVGVSEELPPDEQIAEILDFFDTSVADGNLAGQGPGNSAERRLNALRNMIEAAGDLIDNELYEDACQQLADALKKTDGQVPPPDFVAGEAREELENMLLELMESLGCE